MKKAYLVYWDDVDGCNIVSLHETLEGAEKVWNQEKLKLLKERIYDDGYSYDEAKKILNKLNYNEEEIRDVSKFYVPLILELEIKK